MAIQVSIYKRKSGSKTVYSISWPSGIPGKYKREVIGTSKKMAELAADAKYRELNFSEPDTPRDIISYSKLCDEFTERNRRTKEATKVRYRSFKTSAVAYFEKYFPAAASDISQLKRIYIEEYLDYLKRVEKKADKTINDTIGFIAATLKHAVKMEYLAKSPAVGITRYKINLNKESPFFTVEELKQIWEVITPYWVPFLRTLYLTGTRISELINLTWSYVNLDIDEPTITIIPYDDYDTKTGEKRVITLHEDAVELIRQQIGKHDKYVFISQTGKKIHPDVPGRSLKSALDELGLEGSPHKLRHSFASHLAMAGKSIYKIQKLLGHKDLASTQRYAHLIPQSQKDVVDALKG